MFMHRFGYKLFVISKKKLFIHLRCGVSQFGFLIHKINFLRDHPIIHVQFGFNQISSFYAFLKKIPICFYVKAVSCASEVKKRDI